MSLLSTLERLAGLQSELTGQAQACLGLLQQEELGPLMDVMERRRLLFAEVMALHQELARALPGLEQALAALPAPRDQQATRLLQGIKDHSSRMQDLDRQSATLLEVLLERLRAELGRLGQGQRVLNAYRSLPTNVHWGPDQLSRTC
ncbi:MAG: hypothetical protein V1806_14570 [Pseudomonadota bacterium]